MGKTKENRKNEEKKNSKKEFFPPKSNKNTRRGINSVETKNQLFSFSSSNDEDMRERKIRLQEKEACEAFERYQKRSEERYEQERERRNKFLLEQCCVPISDELKKKLIELHTCRLQYLLVTEGAFKAPKKVPPLLVNVARGMIHHKRIMTKCVATGQTAFQKWKEMKQELLRNQGLLKPGSDHFFWPGRSNSINTQIGDEEEVLMEMEE